MPSAPNFSRRNIVPPQNIEVEEALLGGILLDPEALSRVADKLLPDAFYVLTHEIIYKALLDLSLQGLPTDLIATTDYLIDKNQLQQVGGQAKLIQLLERTVSAVNIDSLARLVMDKYLRRELIKVGSEVTDLGYSTELTLQSVFDESNSISAADRKSVV